MSRSYITRNLDGQHISLKGIIQRSGVNDRLKLVATNINGYLDPSLFDPSTTSSRNVFIQENDPGSFSEPILWIKLNPLIPGDISLILRVP